LMVDLFTVEATAPILVNDIMVAVLRREG
jgi:hypothetical protein